MGLNYDVAAELRAERARGMMSLELLAESTGISRSAVLNYLNGKRDIPMLAFLKLCDALSVAPETILERARG
jgi:transcriptional regulator with XRE-family HTH domain